jgi:hypothetical protein
VDPAFNARFHANVSDLAVTRGRLIAAGKFDRRLVALNPATGATSTYLRIRLQGSVASNAGPTDVKRFEVSPDGRHLVAIGNFTKVGKRAQKRAFVLDLGAKRARLNPWHYRWFDQSCRVVRHPVYLTDVDWNPESTYFVFSAMGGKTSARYLGRKVCDAAARFELKQHTPRRPYWVNYTGGDTLRSVAVTSAAVYVQGHQRWMNNGTLDRPGIAALARGTGLPLDWNPGKQLGIGGEDLLVTPAGLWVASDTRYIGNPPELHERLAFFPLL